MTSKLVKYSDWGSVYFKENAKLLKLPTPVPAQRKYWEFIEILELLKSAGERGIGFGVGEEPMTSALAAMGKKVLATDIGANHSSSKDWDNGQLAKSKESLYKPEIVDRDTFDKNVRFMELDMNNLSPIGDELFDLSFSCGSCEHIGGIHKTIEFLINQMKLLKPGGIAVHTTEYNLDSNDDTVNAHNICLLRKQDIDTLKQRIEAQGDLFYDVDYSTGDEPEDLHIDEPPHKFHQHLKLRNLGFVHTSILLVMQKK